MENNHNEEIVEIGITQINMSRKVKKSTLVFHIISGILMIAVGILGLFISPLRAAQSLSWSFGIIVTAFGVSLFVSSFVLKTQGLSKWWVALIQGLSTAIVGIFLIASPIKETATLVTIFGIVMMITSVIRIITTREDWIFTVLQFILGLIMVTNTAYFMAWGYFFIFSIFIINGIYTVIISIAGLFKKKA